MVPTDIMTARRPDRMTTARAARMKARRQIMLPTTAMTMMRTVLRRAVPVRIKGRTEPWCQSAVARSSFTQIMPIRPIRRNAVSPRRPMRWLCDIEVNQLTKPVARNVVDVPDSE